MLGKAAGIEMATEAEFLGALSMFPEDIRSFSNGRVWGRAVGTGGAAALLQHSSPSCSESSPKLQKLLSFKFRPYWGSSWHVTTHFVPRTLLHSALSLADGESAFSLLAAAALPKQLLLFRRE